jgi:hypothetical protein
MWLQCGGVAVVGARHVVPLQPDQGPAASGAATLPIKDARPPLGRTGGWCRVSEISGTREGQNLKFEIAEHAATVRAAIDANCRWEEIVSRGLEVADAPLDRQSSAASGKLARLGGTARRAHTRNRNH